MRMSTRLRPAAKLRAGDTLAEPETWTEWVVVKVEETGSDLSADMVDVTLSPPPGSDLAETDLVHVERMHAKRDVSIEKGWAR